MKKNVRNILSAVLAVALLAVLLVIPAMADGTAANTVMNADELRKAVADGGNVILGANIDIGNGAVEIDKTVVLELNGKTLSCPGDTKGDGIFHVVAGGKLTINGDGTINSKGNNNYSMAVWADGGEVIINGGTYTNVGCKVDQDPDNNHYDLIYVKNGGSVSIHGGTFECEIPKWTLNSHDTEIGTFQVHGGAFVEFDPTNAGTEPGGTVSWLASGSTCTAVGSTYNVMGVAAVGNAQYATLQEALNVANAGDTVTLFASYNNWKMIKVSESVTIDLNGFDIERSFGGAAVDVTDGTVTITGKGTVSGATSGILVAYDANLTVGDGVVVEGRDGHGIDNDGILTINGAVITGTEYGVAHYEGTLTMNSGSVSGQYGIAAYTDTKVTVNGGTVTGTTAALSGHGEYHGTIFTITDGTIQSENGVGIYHPQNGTLTISGGTITGATGINMKSGTLSVTGGTINGTGEKVDYGFVASGFNTTGDALVLESCGYPGGAPVASITSGTFNSQNAASVASYAGNGVTVAVTGFVAGGSFSDNSAEAYLVDDYCAVKVGDYYLVHKHNLDFVKPSDATCTGDGNVAHYHCSICGMNFADEAGTTELKDIVVPASHTFGDWMPKKAATCTEAGHEDHFLCSVCGLYKLLSTDGETYVDATAEEVIIPALGHKLAHVESKPATCTGDGNEEYWYCETCSGGKIFADKALTTETTLEKVTIPAGHNYTSHVYAKDATCTENGYVEYWACNDCLVVEIVTENGRVESTQDKAIIPAKGHTMTKVETKTPTCTGDGNVEYYHCSACEKNYADEKGEKELTTVVEAAKGHKLVKVEAKAASCTTAGNIEHYSCDSCKKLFADAEGKTETTAEKVAVAAKGHTEVAVAGKAATCTETGLTEGKKCSVCGTVTVEQKIIGALGHKLTKVEAKEATYTEAGNIEHYACACGKLFADAEGKKEITDVVIAQLIKVEEEKAEVSTGAVDNAIADAKEKAEETGKPVEVVIEVPKAPVVEEPDDGETSDTPEVKPQEVVKVELPVEALENVAKEEATLTVVMPSVTVTVDTDALKTVTEQAAGNTVTLVVEQVKEETLTEKQQEAVKKYDVAVTIKAEFICQETNEKIWTEDDNAEKESGSVTVKMPFTPAEGTEGSDYTVLYIADDGTVKEIETAFVDGHLVFALEHFSEYVVVNTNTTSVTPDTGDHALLVPFALLLVLSVAGVSVMTAGKKKLI